jgi:hypothetical protein
MNKFKMFGGFAVGGAILAATVGSAAGLTVNQGQIQEGTLSDVRCDTTGVSVHYNTTGEFQVQKVTIDNVDAQCAGGELDVIIKAEDGTTTLWTGATAIPSSFTGGSIIAGTAWGAPYQLDATHTLSPAAIGSVHVFVYDTEPAD